MAQCPSCRKYQKATSGDTCKHCDYVFILDESVKPYLSDHQVALSIQILSGQSNLYFTERHLYARLFERAKNNLQDKTQSHITSLYVVTFLLSMAIWMMFDIGTGLAIGAVITTTLYLVYVRVKRKPQQVEHGWIKKAMSDYLKENEVEYLVKGDFFNRQLPEVESDELSEHAPDRILIVEHDAWVDFLILNQFHFNHKTLVVSANKYPQAIYDLICDLLKKHPSLPVLILHDLSDCGLALTQSLIDDESWPLSKSKVVDIGLDADEAPYSGIWMPVGRDSEPDWPIIEVDGKRPSFYIEQGFCHALEFWLNPDRMLNDLSLAVKDMISISAAHQKISSEMIDRIQSAGSARVAATATGFSATYEVDEG